MRQTGQKHCSNFTSPPVFLCKELSIIYLINLYGLPITYPDIKGSFQYHLLTPLYHKVLALNTGPTCYSHPSHILFHIWFSLSRWDYSLTFLWRNSIFSPGSVPCKSLLQNIFSKMATRCPFPHGLFTMWGRHSSHPGVFYVPLP